jgi:hypothetical protein
MPVITRAHRRENVVALIISRAGEVLDPRRGDYAESRWRNREPFVDEDLRVLRVIDDEQGNEIEEMCFPELGGDSQIVCTVA